MEVEDLILQISIGANSFDQIPLSNLASFWKKSPIARAQEIIRLCNRRKVFVESCRLLKVNLKCLFSPQQKRIASWPKVEKFALLQQILH
jgi:hypothetical protein